MGARTLGVAVVASIGLLAAACAGGDAAGTVTERATGASEIEAAASYTIAGEADVPDRRHAVLDLGEGWELRSAVDYEVDPDLGDGTDWWAEHERFGPVDENGSFEGFSVRLSGHDLPAVELVERLTRLGFVLESVDVAGTDGQAGTSPDGPVVVVWSLDDTYALMVLSSDLDVIELVGAASATRVVTGAEWAADGGEFLACVPGSDGCGVLGEIG
ncbi:MAG: hypothetical protein AAGD18_07330 [Actinomycetota bacterium]